MNETIAPEEEVAANEGDLQDPFAIDYNLLPEAPPQKKPSLWEVFLLGWQHFTPHFPERAEITIVRRKRKNR